MSELKKYSPVEKCPKCADAIWICEFKDFSMFDGGECLKIKCGNCKYETYRATLDAA